MSVGNTIILTIIGIFLLSGTVVHYRGRVRHSLKRQVTSHSTLMAPYNNLMYLFSAVPNTPYLDVDDLPELNTLRDNWKIIRDEALQLRDAEMLKAADGYTDLAFNSFFRKGWTRFYLKWYDDFLPSAREHCPKTVELLRAIPSVNAALFAELPPGGRLVEHRDPFAGSLRYHLGLATPNSEECRITVDGEPYFWKDGEGVVFDETFIHRAENHSDRTRIILFCDVRRPLKFGWANAVNGLMSRHVVKHSATRNTENEKLGFLNKVFSYLYYVRIAGKKLKRRNRTLYYVLKYVLLIGFVVLLLWLTR